MFLPANSGLISTCVTLKPEYINPLKATESMSSAIMTDVLQPDKEMDAIRMAGTKKAEKKKKMV